MISINKSFSLLEALLISISTFIQQVHIKGIKSESKRYLFIKLQK